MSERHADPIDAATDLAEEMNSRALANFRKQNVPQTHPDFDGKTCIDCADDIPAVRLEMGRIRCVACQGVLERKQRIH